MSTEEVVDEAELDRVERLLRFGPERGCRRYGEVEHAALRVVAAARQLLVENARLAAQVVSLLRCPPMSGDDQLLNSSTLERVQT